MKNTYNILSIVVLIVPIVFALQKIPNDVPINLIDITGQTVAQVNKKTLKLLRKMCPPLLHVTIELVDNSYNLPTGLNKNEIDALMRQLETGIKPLAPGKVQPNRYVPKNVVDLDKWMP